MSGRNQSQQASSASRAAAAAVAVAAAANQTPTRPQPSPPRYAYVPTPQSQQKQRDDASNEGAIYESSIAPEVAGVYGPLLRVRHKREIENSSIVPLPPKVIGGLRDQVERIKVCNCKKSNCLKLYCDCFTGGIHCNAYCNCSGCQNDGAAQNQVVRNKAILAALEKNPDAFRSRGAKPIMIPDGELNSNEVISVASAASKTGGCNCRKSRCLKKYCECYNRNAVCSSLCRCHDCQNFRGNPEREEKIKHEALSAEKQQRLEKVKHDYIVAWQKQQLEGGKETLGAGGKPVGNVSANITDSKDGSSLKRPPPGSNDTTTVGGEAWNTPSSYTIPMKLKSGEPSATLAFCQAGTAKGKADEGNSGVSEAASTSYGGNIVDMTMDELASKSKSQADKQAELEQKWSLETQDVMGTFEAMKHELLERKRDAGLIDGDIALSLSREYSYYDLVGSSLLASVELDLVDVKEAMKEAEDRARIVLAVERKEGSSRIDTDTPHTGGDGGEAESRPTKSPRIGHPEMESATIQAAQDAALMSELARIIRRRALEMSEARMSKNSLPSETV